MSTLLLRLAAPLQSWGAEAKFERRTTERMPTKSGVVGLVAAALGIRRNESIAEIAALRFGVRADREGVLLRDYHIARSASFPYETHRYYLADAVFLAGLEGDDALLAAIDAALSRPAFPLFLGRRSCPPVGRVSMGIRKNVALEEALSSEPALVPLYDADAENGVRLRIMADTADLTGRAYFIRDVPVSFDQTHRRFGFRRVTEYTVPCWRAAPETPTEHDPMAELED